MSIQYYLMYANKYSEWYIVNKQNSQFSKNIISEALLVFITLEVDRTCFDPNM